MNFTLSNPRRATDITIRGGAEARGVGIGDRIADIKAAFRRRKVDRSQEDVFGLTFVFVPNRNGVRIKFAVDVDTKKITLIGVPFIASASSSESVSEQAARPGRSSRGCQAPHAGEADSGVIGEPAGGDWRRGSTVSGRADF